MKLVLVKFLNTPVLASPVKAMKLYEILSQKLKAGNRITIDFSGIKGITSYFLYIVFNNLLKEYEKNIEVVKNLISISNPTTILLQEIEYLKFNYKTLKNKIDLLTINFN